MHLRIITSAFFAEVALFFGLIFSIFSIDVKYIFIDRRYKFQNCSHGWSVVPYKHDVYTFLLAYGITSYVCLSDRHIIIPSYMWLYMIE